jgi:predicted nucleic acid-binding protein
VKLFLDTSVLLAASGSERGASRAIFDLSRKHHWRLLTSYYCIIEVERNLRKLPENARHIWDNLLSGKVAIVNDAITLDKPLSFSKAKDKPVLITAIAESCHTLLTLDKKDFGFLLNHTVYGLWVRTPACFLENQRNLHDLDLS